jgi:hypothetical protein
MAIERHRFRTTYPALFLAHHEPTKERSSRSLVSCDRSMAAILLSIAATSNLIIRTKEENNKL